MKYTRCVLTPVKIEAKELLDSDALDPALLLAATEMLNGLRASAEGESRPIPGAEPYRIGLGLPSRPYLNARKSSSAARENLRRTGFFLESDNNFILFLVVTAATAENDPGLFGTIAGLSAGLEVGLPEEQRDKRSREEIIAEIKAVASDIWASRPAFVSNLTDTYPFSAFIDCFAAAMLLNPDG